MPGPGEYVADSTEGIERVEDLPKARVVVISRNVTHQRCPQCRYRCYRNRVVTRGLHDLGDLMTGRPLDLRVKYSQHRCSYCGRYSNATTTDLAPPKSHYTWRVIRLAVRLLAEDGLPYRTASWHLWRDHRVFVPFATIQNWVEAAGEKRSTKR